MECGARRGPGWHSWPCSLKIILPLHCSPHSNRSSPTYIAMHSHWSCVRLHMAHCIISTRDSLATLKSCCYIAAHICAELQNVIDILWGEVWANTQFSRIKPFFGKIWSTSDQDFKKLTQYDGFVNTPKLPSVSSFVQFRGWIWFGDLEIIQLCTCANTALLIYCKLTQCINT